MALSDYIDPSDTSTGLIFGALAGLGQAATPVPGRKGQGAGLGLLQTIGDIAGGAQQGYATADKLQNLQAQTQGLQQYNAQQSQLNPIAVQQAQMGQQLQQASFPGQLAMAKQISDAQAAGQGFGSLGGMGNAAPNDPAALLNSAMQAAYIKYARTGDPSDLIKVQSLAYEHNPQLAGQVEMAKTGSGVVQTPNGPIMGNQLPGFGSLAPQVNASNPSVTSQNLPPVVQAPVQGQPDPQTLAALQAYRQQQGLATPPIDQERAGLGMPVGVSSNLPNGAAFVPQGATQSAYNPLGASPVLQQIADAGATGRKEEADALKFQYEHNPETIQNEAMTKKEAEDRASNLAEAEKAYATTTANLPNVLNRTNALLAANKNAAFSSFGNDEEGNGVAPKVAALFSQKTSDANATMRQVAAQGLLSELGPQLSQAGVKGNKYLESIANASSNIDLAQTPSGRETQIKGLPKAYLQNMLSAYEQIKNSGGTPAPLPPQAAIEAVRYKAIDPSDITKYIDPGTKIPIISPKGQMGTIDATHLPSLLRAGGKLQ